MNGSGVSSFFRTGWDAMPSSILILLIFVDIWMKLVG